jgi:hypothetical protein
MILQIIKNGEMVETVQIEQFVNASTITIRTAIGENSYRIYPDRTEWVAGILPATVKVHVVTE